MSALEANAFDATALEAQVRPEIGLRHVEQFLFLEARLLDERRLEEWARLFAPDGIYWAPTQADARSPDDAVSLFYDDRASMDARIRRLRHPEAHVAIPHSNTAHMLGNIEAEPAEAGAILARAVFHVAEFRQNEPRWYAGRVEYLLQPDRGSFLISLKKVTLVNSAGSLTSMAFLSLKGDGSMSLPRSLMALTAEQIADYRRDGYVVARGMFSPQEVGLIRGTAENDEALHEAAYFRSDSNGSKTRMTVWNHPGDDIFGLFSRSARIVDSMEALIGEEVYHYNSKLNAKEPFEGGAWEWHQDYGYWYASGCLFPRMATCILALDPSTRENGCLQVLKGSHAAGRIDHLTSGKQVSADPDRIEHLVRALEHIHVEQQPGDVLFFDANMLHASAANASAHRRWVLISCYNGRSNSPVKAHHHPGYTPLDKVPDTAILAAGMRPTAGKVFVDKPYNPLEAAAT